MTSHFLSPDREKASKRAYLDWNNQPNPLITSTNSDEYVQNSITVKRRDLSKQVFGNFMDSGVRKKIAESQKQLQRQTNKTLMPPSMRQQEMQRTKKVMNTLSELRHEMGAVTKKQRLLNSMYKSGITGVDDPCDPNSFLYQEQSKAIQHQNQKKKIHLYRRQKFLETRSMAKDEVKGDDYTSYQAQAHESAKSLAISPLWKQK